MVKLARYWFGLGSGKRLIIMQKPNFLISILDRILPPDLHHLIGDLEEEYHITKQEEGVVKARLKFWSQCIRTMPWFILQSINWNTTMFFNYLKVSWRNMKKHTGFSLINVMGMAISLAVCLLMILFIMDQKSYDQFHENKDRIVRVTSEIGSLDDLDPIESFAISPITLPDILKEQYPEVETAFPISYRGTGSYSVNGLDVQLSGFNTTQDFLDVFGFDLLEGDLETALQEPNTALLTPESAQKLFGETPAIGNTFRRVNGKTYTVTGIIDDSEKSHIDFDVIRSFATIISDPETSDYKDSWKNSMWNSWTYALLKEGTDIPSFEGKIQEQIVLAYTEDGESQLKAFSVQNITNINLSATKYNEIGMVLPGIIVWFLLGFTGIITLIACFNYVSLTVSRALNRSREVGVRKVHGAFRSSVIKQFIIEAVMISLLALVFAFFLLQWLLPEFNSLFFISFMESEVSSSLFFEPEVITAFILFSVLVGLIAGFYPSLYLSSFNPAQVLKGIATTGRLSGQRLKKIITVGQFSFSIIFITSSLILFLQFQHMVDTDYGFDQESVVNISLNGVDYEILKSKLMQDPNVQEVASASLIPAMGSMHTVEVSTDTEEYEIESQSIKVDDHYIAAMGIDLLAGRNFNPEMRTDTMNSVIISTEIVKKLGLESPADALDKKLIINGNKKEFRVIGVINNFISVDPISSNDPTVLFFEPDKARYAIVKTRPDKTISFIGGLDETWKSMNSPYSLEYGILDQELRENPSLIIFIDCVKVIGLIAAFSIFISCLGLLGLAIYSAENRVKEIGIRKVLGASVNQLVFTLSKEYIWMISVAVIISIPAAWFINSIWLGYISNKANFGIMIYLSGAVIAVVLAAATISTQTLRAAKSNPVTNLRSE